MHRRRAAVLLAASRTKYVVKKITFFHNRNYRTVICGLENVINLNFLYILI